MGLVSLPLLQRHRMALALELPCIAWCSCSRRSEECGRWQRGQGSNSEGKRHGKASCHGIGSEFNGITEEICRRIWILRSSTEPPNKHTSNKSCTERKYIFLNNNVGVMATPFMLSKDKIELQFATNHIGRWSR